MSPEITNSGISSGLDSETHDGEAQPQATDKQHNLGRLTLLI